MNEAARGELSRSSSPAPASALALWSSLLGLALLTATVRVPFFVEPPGRDQGLFMTQADLLASGSRLYVDVWEHKQPGIVSLYGAAMALFGDDYRAIQLLNALAGFATAALLLLAFRRVGLGIAASLVPGVLYLLFYAGPIFGGYWGTAQVEIFLDPCVALALYLLLPRAPSRQSGAVPASPARLIAAGVAIGSAVFWLKYSCAPLVGLALLAWWSPAAQGSQRSGPLETPAGRVLAVAVGMLLPLLLVVAYFALSARLGAFWDATIAFNIEHRGVSNLRPQGVAQWGRLLLIRPRELGPLYLFTAAALIGRMIAGRSSERRSRTPRDQLLAAGFLLWLLALAQVVLQGKFWGYHYHVVLLPLAITAGLGIEWLAGGLAARSGRQRTSLSGLPDSRDSKDSDSREPAGSIGRIAAASFAVGLSIALFWPHFSLLGQYAEIHRIAPYWRGEVSHQQFLASYLWGAGGDYDAAENASVAARVAAETNPSDSIFVWGFEPSIYRLSQRAPASRFLYDYPLVPELGAMHQQRVALLMQDLEASKPALVLVLHRDQNALEKRDSAAQLQTLPVLRSFLARHYRAAWRQGDFSALRRLDPAGSVASPE